MTNEMTDELRNDYYAEAGLRRCLAALPVLFAVADDCNRLQRDRVAMVQMIREVQETLMRVSQAPTAAAVMQVWQALDAILILEKGT